MIKNVKCIDASDRKYLTEGKYYTIIDFQDDGDFIVKCDDDVDRKVYASRFENLNKVFKVVKCIDNTDRQYLTEGDLYDVVSIQDDGDYVVIDDRDVRVKVSKERFVEEDSDDFEEYKELHEKDKLNDLSKTEAVYANDVMVEVKMYGTISQVKDIINKI